MWNRLYRTDFGPCLALLVACLAHLFWGSVTTATYYVNAIKVQQNYSQSQVELILPVLSVGKIFSPLPAAVFQTWGATPTITLGMMFSSGGFALMWWTATFYTSPCSPNIALVYVFFFMMGLGSAFFNLSLLTVVTKSFDKHRGKAVSFLMTCYGVSPLLSLLIYRHWFAFDIIDDDGNQDVSGFMLFSAVSTSAAAVVCLMFVRVHPDADSAHAPLIQNMEQDEEVVHQKLANDWTACILTDVKLFCQWRLQMTMWAFALIYAIFCSIDYNLALYAKSSGKYYVFDSCFAIFHISVFLARLAIGFISDIFEGKIPRMMYTCVSSCLLTICLGLASIFPLDEGMLYTVSLSSGLAGGVFRPVIVTEISKRWREKDFAKIWGVTYCTASVVLTIWLAVFSRLLSSATQVYGGRECYGSSCLKWVNITSCGLMLVATIFSCTLSATKTL